MQRHCEACDQARPIRDFDLGDDRRRSVCLSCAEEQFRAEEQNDREQLKALKRRRRSLIAALVKIDAEIAARTAARHSSVFKRVDPIDVLDGSDGFGD